MHDSTTSPSTRAAGHGSMRWVAPAFWPCSRCCRWTRRSDGGPSQQPSPLRRCGRGSCSRRERFGSKGRCSFSGTGHDARGCPWMSRSVCSRTWNPIGFDLVVAGSGKQVRFHDAGRGLLETLLHELGRRITSQCQEPTHQRPEGARASRPRPIGAAPERGNPGSLVAQPDTRVGGASPWT